MRISFLLLTLLLSATSALAKLNGDGYYRIQNYESKRYVYVTDDKGEINYNTTTVDVAALQLWMGFEKASSDPATVCYIKDCGSGYDIQAQGTGIYEMVSSYVNLRERNGSYLAYASSDGITKYLGEGEKALELEKGAMSTEASGTWRNWYITPLTLNDNEYFGVKPTINHNGSYYNSFFADFPFSFAGSGMKAMYVYKTENGMAVYKEITGTIPAETPVIIQCSSDQPVNNKLNIGGSASAISGNLMKGVYFHNTSKKHKNLTPYNPETMRMLGVMSNGKLGFIKANIENIPANTGYLSVPAGYPDEIRLVSEQEYNDILASIPKGISLDNTSLSMTEGDTSTLKATLTPATAQTVLTWTSSNTAVATVSNSGVVTAVAPGSATITVTTDNNLSATCTVTVKAKEIPATSVTLNNSAIELVVGSNSTLTATVLPENTTNKSVSWKSDNTAIANVDQNGVVTAVAPGSAIITVSTVNNCMASCTVTVKPILATSISLNINSIELEISKEFLLVATVLPENATYKTVTWASNNTAIATVDERGNVKAIAPGEATITATTTDGSNLSASCNITIPEPIVLAESISLDATTKEVTVPAEFTLTATVLPENTTNKAVKWETDNASVATVDKNGNVKVIAAGKATITATSTDGTKLSASCEITAVDPIIIAESITLNQTALEVQVPSELSLTATVLPENTTNKAVVWESNNTEVATVDENGNVKVIGYGEAIITVTTTDGSNLSASCKVTTPEEIFLAESITLDQTSMEVEVPAEFTLTATVLPEKTSNKGVKWESSAPEIATVDANGNVKVVGEGVVTITATTTDGTNLSASCEITAKYPIFLAESITLNNTSKNVVAPFEFTLIATVLPEHTTNSDVKWESNNTEVATVDDDGNVKVLVEGEAIITATTTDGSNLSASCIINAISSVEDIFVDQKPKEVYTLTGIYVGTVTSPTELSPGIYIIDKQKVIIK